jgi:hypothetical protein
LEENIVMLQDLETFRKAFRGNIKEEKKRFMDVKG